MCDTPTSMTVSMAEGKLVSLRNHTCPYCGQRLEKVSRDRDHVIGRNFVPRGALDGAWNLILNTCKPCHARKSDLEDESSAITLQPDLVARQVDPIVAKEAERKGRGSVSRRTGKIVKDSLERGKFTGSLGPGMTFSFETIAPAQLQEDRVHELARFHALALFYLLTYDEKKHEGKHPPGVFMPVDVARRSDWGNAIQRAFAERISSWPMRIGLDTAGGYFRALIRRNMPEDCWAFAFEWNRNIRCIGLFGDPASTQTAYETFPSLETVVIAKDERSVTRMREEKPLPENDDTLFRF